MGGVRCRSVGPCAAARAGQLADVHAPASHCARLGGREPGQAISAFLSPPAAGLPSGAGSSALLGPAAFRAPQAGASLWPAAAAQWQQGAAQWGPPQRQLAQQPPQRQPLPFVMDPASQVLLQLQSPDAQLQLLSALSIEPALEPTGQGGAAELWADSVMRKRKKKMVRAPAGGGRGRAVRVSAARESRGGYCMVGERTALRCVIPPGTPSALDGWPGNLLPLVALPLSAEQAQAQEAAEARPPEVALSALSGWGRVAAGWGEAQMERALGGKVGAEI